MIELMNTGNKYLGVLRVLFVSSIVACDYQLMMSRIVAFFKYFPQLAIKPIGLVAVLLSAAEGVVLCLLVALFMVIMRMYFYWNKKTISATSILLYIIWSGASFVRALLRLTYLITPIAYLYEICLGGILIGVPAAIVFNILWEKWYRENCTVLLKKKKILYFLGIMIAVGASFIPVAV